MSSRPELTFNVQNSEDAAKSIWDWSEITQKLAGQFEKTRELLSSFDVSAEKLKPLRAVATTAEPYGRKVLFRSEKFEVMLASWTQGAECAPHDHGFSRGVVWLVDGDFVEMHYDLQQDLKTVGKGILRPEGSFLRVTPGDIHSMVASNGGLSLHIYTPAIHRMKVYDQAQRRTLTVSDDCGAWIPLDTTQILDQEPW